MSEENTPAPENNIEQRITALVGQRDAAQAQADATSQQNQVLAQRLASLEETITAMARPRSSAPPPKAATTLTPGDDLAATVRAIVQEAITPLAETLKETAEKTSRKEKHDAAFRVAVTRNPELNDPESNLYKVASRLWDSRPDLTRLDDAPVIIAEIARGVVAGERVAAIATTEAKRQAGITPPQPASRRVDLTSSETDRAIEAAKSKAEAGMQSGEGPQAFADFFRATLTERVKKAQE